MNTDNDKLLAVAKNVTLPDWATHVAVSKVRGNEGEPCAWSKMYGDYFDENPEDVEKWASSYKHAYWAFFSREELL